MTRVRHGWGKATGLWLALTCALTLPAHAQERAPAQRAERTLTTRLQNGLEVVLSEAREQPTFSLALRYRVGSRNDPKELSELAHLVEHLSFAFSKNVSGSKDQLAELAGVDSNAMTGIDATTFVSSGNVGALARVLWLERQRMAFTLERLTQQEVELERRTLNNERSTIRLDDEAGLYWNLVSDALYPAGHPYAPRPERGCIDRCSLQHAQWLMQRGYRPDNARLVIVGDFDAEATLGLVRRLLGTVQNPSVALPPLAQTPARAGYRHIVIAAPVERPSVQLLWVLPEALRTRRADFEVLDAYLSMLLEHELVDKARMATRVSASFASLDLHPGWSIDVELLPGIDTTSVEQRILAQLDRLREQLPSIQLARQHALLALLERWEAPSSRVSLLLQRGAQPVTRDEVVAAMKGVTQTSVAQLLRALPARPSLSVGLRRAIDAPQRGALYREGQ